MLSRAREMSFHPESGVGSLHNESVKPDSLFLEPLVSWVNVVLTQILDV